MQPFVCHVFSFFCFDRSVRTWNRNNEGTGRARFRYGYAACQTLYQSPINRDWSVDTNQLFVCPQGQIVTPLFIGLTSESDKCFIAHC
uniref:Uncharacterized protein n=1 Tax=Daphnia magna TaxID=35525 RepID=A0A0P6IL81_9CRUS